MKARVLKNSLVLFCKVSTIYVILFVISYYNSISAQSIANYQFSSSTSTFSSNIPSSPTNIHTAGVDNAMSGTLNIGFDFYYNGTRYTQFKASSNGYITLNTGASDVSSNQLNSTNANNQLIIAPLWDDLSTKASTGYVRYKTEGTAPNRVLKVYYYDMCWKTGQTNDLMDFLVMLYETSNKIEFNYNNKLTAWNAKDASIGINGNSNPQQFLSIRDINTWSTTTEYSVTAAYAPSTNRLFTLTPPAISAPTNVYTKTLSQSQIKIYWTDNTSDETGYVLYYSTNPNVPLDGTSSTRIDLSSVPGSGSNTSHTVSGLAANTTYYFKLFAKKEGLSSHATATGTTGVVFTNASGDNLWYTASNWSSGSRPTSTDNVIIPSGKTCKVILTSSPSWDAHCNNLIVEQGATLIAWSSTSSSYFFVHGNLEINGTYSCFNTVSGQERLSVYFPMILRGGTTSSYKTITIGPNANTKNGGFMIGTSSDNGYYRLNSNITLIGFCNNYGAFDMNGYNMRCWQFWCDATFTQGSGNLYIEGHGNYIKITSGYNCGTGRTYFCNGNTSTWSGSFYKGDGTLEYFMGNYTVPSLTYNNLWIRTNNGYTTTFGSGGATTLTVNNDLLIVNPGAEGGVINTANNIIVNGNFTLGNDTASGITLNLGHRIYRSNTSGSGTFSMYNDLNTTDKNTINITYAHATQTAIALGASGTSTNMTFYGKVIYNSNSNQLVMGPNYKNIEFNGSGTKSLTTDLNVEKDINLIQGTLDVGFGSATFETSSSTEASKNMAASTPFNPKPSDNKVQYLYTASMLSSYGLTPGSEIQKIAYYVCNFDTSRTYQSFTIKMGHSTATSIPNGGPMISTTMTTVFGPSTITVSSNGWFEFNLSTPFVWDGSSSIVIEYCFDNCDNNGNCVNLSRPYQEVYVDASTSPTYYSAQKHTLNGDDVCDSTKVANQSYKLPRTRFTASAQHNIYLAGNWINHPTNTIGFIYRQSTVYFDGNTTQYINQNGRNIDFYNVVVDGADVRFYNAGSNAANQKVEITNNLTVNASKTLKLMDPASTNNNGSITLSGNLVNNGTINGESYFNGTSENAYFTMNGTNKTISGSGTYTSFYLESDGSISITNNNLSVSGVRVKSGKSLTLNDNLTLTSENDISIFGTYTAQNNTTTQANRDIIINSGGTLTPNNTATDPILKVGRYWHNNGTFNYNESKVIFINPINSYIRGTSVMEFYKLEINKPSASYSVTLDKQTTVRKELILTTGIIKNTQNELLVLIDNAISNEGNNNSYVDGFVMKEGDDAFVFPVGNLGVWAPIGIQNLANSSTSDQWIASYYYQEPPDTGNYENPPIHHISRKEYWKLEKANGAANLSCKVKLFWKDKARSGIVNESELLVAHYTNRSGTTRWWSEGNNTYASGTQGWILSEQLTTNGLFTFASSTANNPLPIEICKLKTYCEERNFVIEWATCSETNNDYFLVETSYDMVNWVQRDRIKGAGSTNNVTTYKYKLPYDESSKYYRITQYDNNSQSKLFDIGKVICNNEEKFSFNVSEISFIQNRLRYNVYLSDSCKITMRLYDVAGKLIMGETLLGNKGSNSFAHFVDNADKGIYFLIIGCNEQYSTFKISN